MHFIPEQRCHAYCCWYVGGKLEEPFFLISYLMIGGNLERLNTDKIHLVCECGYCLALQN